MPATRHTAAQKTRLDPARELEAIDGFDEGRRLRGQILDLGERMRELRKKVLGITQTQAAKLIGMEQSELSRIENGVGNRGPSYSTITRIIEAYQSYLRAQDPTYHLSLNIQLRHGDAQETDEQLLVGG